MLRQPRLRASRLIWLSTGSSNIPQSGPHFDGSGSTGLGNVTVSRAGGCLNQRCWPHEMVSAVLVRARWAGYTLTMSGIVDACNQHDQLLWQVYDQPVQLMRLTTPKKLYPIGICRCGSGACRTACKLSWECTASCRQPLRIGFVVYTPVYRCRAAFSGCAHMYIPRMPTCACHNALHSWHDCNHSVDTAGAARFLRGLVQ